MPQQTAQSAENNFTQGLRTEFTGLNFPENAATDAQNVVFERIGNAHRRAGIDYEANYQLNLLTRDSNAISTHVWRNAGGDGNTIVLVKQLGSTLYFYEATDATVLLPLSHTLLASTVSLTNYTPTSVDTTIECQYADGNGFLVVCHPSCNPFYVTFTSGSPSTVTASTIDIKIRDLAGLPEQPFIGTTNRPATLAITHHYNLLNQGWIGVTSGTPGVAGTDAWNTTGLSSETAHGGNTSFTLNGSALVPAVAGQTVTVQGYQSGVYRFTMIGTVTSYSHPALVLNITDTGGLGGVFSLAGYDLNFTCAGTAGTPAGTGTTYIDAFSSAAGGYPSNSDIWWSFKDSSGSFNPVSTLNQVYVNSAQAPRGYYVLEAMKQDRTTVSGVTGISAPGSLGPRTGCWFQGRVFYSGIDFSDPAGAFTPHITWTENIYFSQIIEDETTQLGKCYQENDPTSPDTFDLLESDGGVIHIPGTGSIFKLFPIQNGLLVFAANGIWFVTGGQSIGFKANDYTITKISGIQATSGSTFVDVQGFPMWWNDEGIYQCTAGQSGLEVQPIAFTTILTEYQAIPISSTRYAKGTYDPLDYVVKWLYKSTEATGVLDRYSYDRVLTYNLSSQSWYIHTLPDPSVSGTPTINAIVYVQNPGGQGNPLPVVKYLTSIPDSSTIYNFTFSEENDETNWVDFTSSGTDYNYTSYFETGYKVHGKAQLKVQANYLYVYLNNLVSTGYRHQGIWSYAIARDSNKYTALETVSVTEDPILFGVVVRRHRLRGRGLVYQFRVESMDGKPFDIIGWSIQEKISQNT